MFHSWELFTLICFLGEALGAIGNQESVEVLQKYANDAVIEVRFIYLNETSKLE